MIELERIIDALEFVNSCIDGYAYYNQETDEIYYVGDSINELEEYDDDFIDSCYTLPSKYQIDEYSMMEEFIETIKDTSLSNELSNSIIGHKAFRRFKDTCIKHNIIDEWYKFRDKQYRRLAKSWCDKNNIKYKESEEIV